MTGAVPLSLIPSIASGRTDAIQWLRQRIRARAATRFSSWAWSWIEDDFASELVLQLTVTTTKPGFTLEGSSVAYVDTCIANLCTKYFRQLARLRRSDPLEDHPEQLADASAPSLDRVAAALELRRTLLDLPVPCRRILVEKYALGMTLEEIGARAGVEPKTIQSRLHSCRGRLRDLLATRGSRRSKRGRES